MTGADANLVDVPTLLASPDAWDRALAAIGGRMLQSAQWGELKSRHGWSAERVAVRHGADFGMAQVLFKQKGPVSIGYVPRGPALSRPSPELAEALFAEVDRVCRARRAISVIVEPDVPLPYQGSYKAHRFVRADFRIQPGRTVKVPLLADEPLLAQMHHKHRYNARLATRRGASTEVVASTDENIDAFHAMMADTSGRNLFGIHGKDYYADFLRLFGGNAALLFASVDGALAAGLVVARFGSEGFYMYGASSTRNRAHGAATLLQVDAMRWCRDRGCESYDLWGIPDEDPVSTATEEGDRVAATRGNDLRGLYEFKTRFGGSIVTYPPAVERRYVPVLAALARRVYRPTG